MSHRRCAVPHCGIIIMPTSLCCGAHWGRISLLTQREVWAAYRACAGHPLEAPVLMRSRYFTAVDKAIAEATARAGATG